MPPPRTTVPRALIPAPARQRVRVIRSLSCCSRRVTARRSPAARSRHPEPERIMAVTQRTACEGVGPVPDSSGIGLRFPHHAAFLEAKPAVAWVEVHSENYFSGSALAVLEAVRANYPVSLHSVGLSLGSAQGVDHRHLARIADLAERIDPGLMSEHLAWGAVDHDFLADLLPLPLTEESLEVV